MNDDFIFTSESVTRGHPDKLCDQVSDGIVDHFLKQDPSSRIVAECAVSSGVMFISAHYASQARLDIPDIARRVIRSVGYSKELFDADACTIMTSFMDHTATDYLSYDLDNMDDAVIDRIPARQQASVFGYACDQTPALMPLPIWLAHRLAEQLAFGDGPPWAEGLVLPRRRVAGLADTPAARRPGRDLPPPFDLVGPEPQPLLRRQRAADDVLVSLGHRVSPATARIFRVVYEIF